MRKLSALLVFGFACSAFAQVEVTDLGTLGGGQSAAFAINDSNQIVGESRSSNGDPHIFLYQDGSLVDISATYNIGPGEYGSAANGLSTGGQIAANISNGHAAILAQGQTTDLGTFGGIYSSAMGINKTGQTVGYYSMPGFLNHAFLYSNGNMIALGPFGPQATSIATGINDSGMVVGHATDDFAVPAHAFLYANGVMIDISPFGNSESYAHAINNRGQIVGEFLNAAQTAFHAFIYSNGVYTDLGFANSPETVAYGINDRGQAVGTTWAPRPDSSRGHEFEQHAFVYSDGVMTDLNTLLPHDSPWRLAAAYGINNQGKIVGYGMINGQYRGFLLSWARLQPSTPRAGQPPLPAKGAAPARSSR